MASAAEGVSLHILCVVCTATKGGSVYGVRAASIYLIGARGGVHAGFGRGLGADGEVRRGGSSIGERRDRVVLV